MSQTASQPRQHKFFDNHTVLGTIVLIICGYCIVMLPASIAVGLISGFLRITNFQDYLFIGVGAMSFVMLLIHRLWFYPDFKGILFSGIPNALRCSAVMLIFWLLLCLPDFLNGSYPHTFTLEVLSLSLTAGFSEEVIFRGLPLSYLKRQMRSEKQIPLIVIITGAVFGLTHVSNILFGATVSASLVQGVTTTCIGIFFGAVFMRSGNIFIPMLLHTLHDYLILSFQEADEVSATITVEASPADIFPALLCAGLAAFGFFLIRKSKRGEICKMWADKWSQTTEPVPAAPAEPAPTVSE